jgi:hypothetical protein
MSGREQRRYPRLEMYSAVMLVHGEQAYLTEVSNVSLGGSSVARPNHFKALEGDLMTLFFVFDQDTILSIQARVAHVQQAHIGFQFTPGQEARASELLEESRHWDKFAS